MPYSTVLKQNLRLAVDGELPRFWRMNRYEAYYWGWQYADLKYEFKDPYFVDDSGKQTPIPLRERKPSLIMDLPKAMVNAVASMLFSSQRFPDIQVQGGENAQEWVQYLIKTARLRKTMKKTAVLGNIVGTSFLVFNIFNGRFSLKTYNGKVCYPTFREDDPLEPIEVRIIYRYKDDDDKWRWFRKDYTENAIILYDNPEWTSGDVPKFQIVEANEHNLGFVPGVWIPNLDGELPESDAESDGMSLYEGKRSYFDSLNYQLSQLDRGLHVNMDPQLVLTGLTQADYSTHLQKSPLRTWALGQQGDAKYIEASGLTYEKAEAFIKSRTAEVLKLSRVILMDPETVDIKGDSARAMERLFAPMLSLIDDERVNYGDEGIVPLMRKMLQAVDILKSRGIRFYNEPKVSIDSVDVSLSWGDFFEPGSVDLRDNLDRTVSAMNAGLITEETAVRYVASDFAIEDVNHELERLQAERQQRVDAFSGLGQEA